MCISCELLRDQHHEHQLGNHWVWHTRTASITSISCELLWPRNQQVIITRSAACHTQTASITSISCQLLWPCNQQVIITRSAWKHLGLAHTNGQHHQHQLRIALAPQSKGHHHGISLETLGPGAHERPASPASAANCCGPEVNKSP